MPLQARRVLALLVAMATGIVLFFLLRQGTQTIFHTWSPRKEATKSELLVSSAAVATDLSSSSSSSSSSFAIRFPLNFPLTTGVRPMAEVVAAPWVDELKAFLATVPARQVNVVTADSQYLPVLLNWLVVTQVRLAPPMAGVLVVALDRPLHLLLRGKHIPHVFARPSSVLDMDAMHSKWSHIWIIRCVVLRLLNHWGYDAATFDADAVPVGNPQTLFDRYPNSDVVASRGKYPFEVGSKWGGPTLCMGVALFRASNRTEALWEMTSRVRRNSLDDQSKVNYGLLHCGVEWAEQEVGGATREGHCKNGLRVTLLSNSDVCRRCDPRAIGSYTVWHLLSRKNSESKLAAEHSPTLWRLRPDWQQQLHTEETGSAWLRQLSL